jgi:hypothetical protein
MKTPKISLDDQIRAAKSLDRGETWAEWMFWISARWAYRTGDATGLVDVLRKLGPKAFLDKSLTARQKHLGRMLSAQALDNVAALIAVGILAFKRAPRAGSSRGRSLYYAKKNYDRIRRYGALGGINPDGSPQLKQVSAGEAIELTVKSWNSEVERRRERLNKMGQRPHLPLSVSRITADQLRRHINKGHSSARRYAKRQANNPAK